eukprot:TRINITY_DN112434_c0_g1_i1.p1 TRINITY_DN112434_c0_g1~~TRINITY_DN112434_c0_g1_i1.p1  ORF type:complete len:111 (-),score=8.39 TRINITY_DN112434_c0_g1_i1:202-534(-)
MLMWVCMVVLAQESILGIHQMCQLLQLKHSWSLTPTLWLGFMCWQQHLSSSFCCLVVVCELVTRQSNYGNLLAAVAYWVPDLQPDMWMVVSVLVGYQCFDVVAQFPPQPL